MTTQHRNHARNIYASLEHLNQVTGHRYALRRQDSRYILVSPVGEYPAKDSLEIQHTLMDIKNAAQGRTR
jgi:hypothetical protein